MEVMNHFDMTGSRSLISARPGSSSMYKEISASTGTLEWNNNENCVVAISTGRTSCLPLIGLPKKKVDFNPTQCIIQPIPIENETWRNLSAEIVRRKSTSSNGTVEDIVIPPPAPADTEQPGRIVRLHRRFKKALTRLRKVFHHSPDVETSNSECRPSLVYLPRTLVRRDSNVSSAKRLAAKRKRSSLTDHDFLDREWLEQCRSENKPSIDLEEESSQITSELQEIFEHLTVSVSKRPRLDHAESYSCHVGTY